MHNLIVHCSPSMARYAVAISNFYSTRGLAILGVEGLGLYIRIPPLPTKKAPTFVDAFFSEWRDSNPRLPGPKPGALARLSYTP